MKGIHFGAGGYKIPGWLNADRELDVTKTPFNFPDNSIEACFTSHCAEHISGPDMLRFFTDIHRILKPGGWFRLSIPVVGPWLSREHARDLATNHGHCAIYNEELLRTYFWMAGFDQQKVQRVERWEHDHHHKTIGDAKDYAETCRMLATK